MNKSQAARIPVPMTFRSFLVGGALLVGCGASAVASSGAGDASGPSADAAPSDAPEVGDGSRVAEGASPQDPRDSASASDSMTPIYPNCSLQNGSAYYPCGSTQSCVADCQTCPGAANDCLVSSYPNGSISTSCVAACATCNLQTSEDGGIPFKDLCGNECTSVTLDKANCGACGYRCPPGALICSNGHCCGDDGHGQPLQWNAGCQMCCSTGGFIGQCVASGCQPAG